MILEGKALVLGAKVDTDVILPGKYLTVTDPEELGRHALEGMEDQLPRPVGPGDIIVAGRYFGCGSSREQAPVALKHAGVRAVLAATFARIFFRNAINVGLPALELPTDGFCQDGDRIQVDLKGGVVANLTSGKQERFKPLPGFIMEILEAGGLTESIRRSRS